MEGESICTDRQWFVPKRGGYQAAMSQIVIEGRRSAAEAAVSAASIRYLPFDVPSGVTALRVQKEFDHGPDPKQSGMIDLGLFDPRGYGMPEAVQGQGALGFRGWQGGTLDDLVLTGDFINSSPQCLAGPIPAGRWHLGQWYIKGTSFGVGYKYTILFSFDGPQPQSHMPLVPTYEPGVLDSQEGWYPGNPHVHTIHSDGGHTLAEVVAANQAAGFRFVVCTDHNTPRGHYEFAEVAQDYPTHLLIAGNELTSPCGHAGIIGQRPGYWFDFRIDGGDGQLPQLIREAHRQNALFVINHPFQGCTTCLWRYPFAEHEEADAVEVWNGIWGEDDRRALEWWDEMLKAGRRIHAMGGSDFHHSHDPLLPVVWVYARNLSQPAVMEALRQGRIFLSETTRGPGLYLSTADGAVPSDSVHLPATKSVSVQVHVVGGHGMTLRLVWREGDVFHSVEENDLRMQYTLPGTNSATVGGAPLSSGKGPWSYVRAELMHPGGKMAALTNPIYLQS